MTAASIASIAPVLKVNGSELPSSTLDSLIGMRISRGLRLPSRARLEFLDDGFAISAANTFAMGAKVVVKSGTATLFTGEVTGVELDIDRGASNITVIADDAAYEFTLGNKVRTFTQMTFSDIVKQMAGEVGLQFSVTATTVVHPYVMQADSDFGFLSEMADRVGYDWWVDESGLLQFHPMCSQAGDHPTLSWDPGAATLRQIAVRASALHPQKVQARGWDSAQTQAVVSDGAAFSPVPDAQLVSPFISPGSLSSRAKATTGHSAYSTSGDGTTIANSAVAAALTGAVRAEGVCLVNPGVKVGHQVALDSVGPASGMYWVTEVEHIYSPRGFDTRFVAGERQPAGLVDTLAAPVVSSLRQDSLIVGVVTNITDPESTGRVKVKFPTLGDQVESAWARVAAIGAADKRGVTFLPEINDEVIVGFEGGAASRPVVLGGLYSSNKPALEYGVQNNTIVKRQIVSRLGHVIELGDGDGEPDQHIWLTLEGNQHAIQLGKDGLTAKVPSGKPVSITSGDTKVEFDASGNITLSGQKITIKAAQDVEISALNIKLKANVAVEASGTQIKISGNAQTEVSSSGMTSIKGSMVAIN